MNEYEIHVIHLQRHGGHAIVNWIMSQCSGIICFLNNVETHRNPLSASQKELKLGKDVSLINKIKFHIAKGAGNRFIHKVLGKRVGRRHKKLMLHALSKLHRDYLIYSHEDFPFEKIFHKEFIIIFRN